MKDMEFLPQEYNIKINIGSILIDIILGDHFLNPHTNFTADAHHHLFYEIQFFLKGDGVIRVDNEDFPVRANEYFVIAPEIYHSHRDNPLNPVSKYCIKFEYSIMNVGFPTFTPKKEMESIIQILSNLKYFHSSNSFNFSSMIEEIQYELSHHAFGYYTKLQTLFTAIFVNILRGVAQSGEIAFSDYNLPNKTPAELRPQIIDRFFYKNYHQHITSEDICNLLYVSKSHLNRILKKYFNTTFKQKLLEIRLEKAKKLLSMTDMSVESISEKVGYVSVESFSSTFKRKTGLSPHAYKTALLKNQIKEG